MNDIFSEENIRQVYFDLKNRKRLDRKKKLPVGVDGVSVDTFERNLDHSIREIHRKLQVTDGRIPYSFAPLLRIERTKSEGGVRLLHIPRLRDQIVLRIIHDDIRLKFERKNYSPYSFIRKFDLHIKGRKNPVVLKSDITQFYDTIPRIVAIENCKSLGVRKEVLELLLNWNTNLRIRRGYSRQSDEITDFTGLPQGISISSLLAEIYVQYIDVGFSDDPGYFRFVDDIVIICDNVDEAKQKLEKLRSLVKDIGLKLSINKTEIVEYKNGLKWLGLLHYPDEKIIHPEKITLSLKPLNSMRKSCIERLQNYATKAEKAKEICTLIKEIELFILGRKGVRVRWYSLCTDHGQWKQMDKLIHGIIRSCIRKAGLEEKELPQLPSIHAKVYSYIKLRESQKNAD
jgi:RNA-directed DNA polymerase